MPEPIDCFRVSELEVELFDEATACHRAVLSGLSFDLGPGEGLGVTGESGSGKTTLGLALSGLLPPGSLLSHNGFKLTWPHGGGLRQAGARRTPASHMERELRPVRGPGIFTLFQEPRASLNPNRTVGWQLARCLGRRRHAPSWNRAALDPEAALSRVGLSVDIVRHHPDELSTGMCQRVFLAMALMLEPSVLVADEPFSSVDADTQDRLTGLLGDWMAARGLTLVLISHDLELLRRLTRHTVVLFRGQVAESGPTSAVLDPSRPIHPYTRLLHETAGVAGATRWSAAASGAADPQHCWFAARCPWFEPELCGEQLPPLREGGQATGRIEPGPPHLVRCVRHPMLPLDLEVTARNPGSDAPAPRSHPRADDPPADACRAPEMVAVRRVAKEFRRGWRRHGVHRVLDDVSFTILEGERLGIVGPSGQGKTTLARLMAGLLEPTRGSIMLSGAGGPAEVAGLALTGGARFRRLVQMMYQDADLVLDPSVRLGESMIEAFRVFTPASSRQSCYARAAELFDELALPATLLEAYPYRLSGGERKRVVLARSMAALGHPFASRTGAPARLLILDEPTAGVDVVLEGLVARFLACAQERLRLTYVVISHDEAFVQRFCHRAIRLENGRVAPLDAVRPAARV